jgi:hypothetical protein
MSTAGWWNASQISATTRFASSASPQMNIVGGPPGSFGFTISVLPTVLNAFTTLAPGSQRWTCSPPESV